MCIGISMRIDTVLTEEDQKKVKEYAKKTWVEDVYGVHNLDKERTGV